MKSIVVIPARMASSRLPGKPLVQILGKSLLQRTYEQCLKAVGREEIYVATDDVKIYDHCREFGAQAVMTPDTCLTGTDRVAELAKIIKADYYINVQGDEPVIDPGDILAVKQAIDQFPGEIINGFARISSEEHFRSLTIPKVVFRPDGRLLYMSRSAIPGNKSDIFKFSHRQICVYAFPADSLVKFYSHGSKTPLEGSEDIEILRFLELGYEVRMIELSDESIAVDTPEDVQRVVNFLNGV